MTWLRSSEKKREIIEETFRILKIHEKENMDNNKTTLRLFHASKKFGVNLKKLRIGDLL